RADPPMVDESVSGTIAVQLVAVGCIVAVEESDDGRGVADVDGQQHQRTSMSRPISSTVTELVSAPLDTTSAPVSAYSPAVSRVIPPEISRSARRAPVRLAYCSAISTQARISSGLMLSRRT